MKMRRGCRLDQSTLRQGKEDTTALQLLLGVLEHEPFLRTYLTETRRDLQIETASLQNPYPAPVASGVSYKTKAKRVGCCRDTLAEPWFNSIANLINNYNLQCC